MEYCSGVSLEQYIKNRGKIPEDEATKILEQLVFGLAVNYRVT
jgi:serine/threonine protein kinase